MADNPAYIPQSPIPIGDENARAVMEWTYQELLRLSRALMTMKALDLQPTYTAPTRPREGMIVHADGVKWNPGSGAGTYAYISGAWTPLSGGTTPAPADADYLVKTANATLTAERVVTDGTDITWDWSVAGVVKAAFSGVLSVAHGGTGGYVGSPKLYSGSNFTLPTNYEFYVRKTLTLASTAQAILQGTGELIIYDFVDITTKGVPKFESFTVPSGYVCDVTGRSVLERAQRATLNGTANLVLTDDFGTRSRITLVGRG